MVAVWRSVVGMGLAVFLWSWFPLAAALMGEGVGVFVFMFWFNLVVCVVWLGFLVVRFPDLVFSGGVWVSTVRGLLSVSGGLAALGSFEVLLFVWATFFVDTALVAVISGGWFVLFVLWQKRLDSAGRYRTLPVGVWVLFVFGIVGAGLVLLSQSGGFVLGGGWLFVLGLIYLSAQPSDTNQKQETPNR